MSQGGGKIPSCEFDNAVRRWQSELSLPPRDGYELQDDCRNPSTLALKSSEISFGCWL